VAIISVLSSAAVALGSAGITAVTATKREHERFASETRREREDELRGVADHAATHLSNAIWQLERGCTHLDDLLPLHEAFGQISNFEDRLAVRLGNNEQEVISYRRAVGDIQDGLTLLVKAAKVNRLSEADDRAMREIKSKALADKRAFRELTARRLSPNVL
jgi:hypothetical protein